MIPTMLLIGLVVGRVWAIPAGATIWAVVILSGTAHGTDNVAIAALLGAANTAVGVVVHQAAMHTLRRSTSAFRAHGKSG
jgi:hypothetical protein